jgi:hypothetical protein
MSTSFYKRMISIHSVPLPFILLTAGGNAIGQRGWQGCSSSTNQ